MGKKASKIKRLESAVSQRDNEITVNATRMEWLEFRAKELSEALSGVLAAPTRVPMRPETRKARDRGRRVLVETDFGKDLPIGAITIVQTLKSGESDGA